MSKKKIFFGHQSVGNNIVDGIYTLKKNHPVIQLNILKGRNSDMFSNGVFAHDRVGDNHDPISKIDDFYSVIEDNEFTIDVAFLKLCFVDISSTSDVNAIFNYYRTKMMMIKEKFPEILIVHFTVPLIRAEKNRWNSSLKKLLKKSLGKKSDSFFDEENNIARNKYNSLLISEYEKKKSPFLI